MKVYYRLIVWIIFAVFALIAGIYFYTVLRQDEKTSREDILSLVPGDAKSILQINEYDRFSFLLQKNVPVDSANQKLFAWEKTLNRSITPIEDNGNKFFPWGKGRIMVSFHHEGEIYYTKLRSNEVSLWKDALENEIFPPFPPIVQKFEGAEILHYTLADNRFFSCTFKDNIFIGSFNGKLIEKVILCRKNGTSVQNDAKFVQISKTAGKKTLATLFYHMMEKDMVVKDTTVTSPVVKGWTSSDITFMDNEIWFSGYYKPDDDSSDFTALIPSIAPVSLFQPHLFPPGVVFVKSYGVDLKTARSMTSDSEKKNFTYLRKDSLSPDSLFLRFAGNEFHTIYIKDSSDNKISKVYCLKMNRTADFEKKLRNYLFSGVPGYYYSVRQLTVEGTRRLVLVFTLRNFNLLSDVVGSAFFPESPQYYLSFSEDYLVVSPDEYVLVNYLSSIGKKQSSEFSNLTENLSDPCHIAILGNLEMIAHAGHNSPLKLSGKAAEYPVFFGKWRIGVHFTNQENLLFYHIVFGKK